MTKRIEDTENSLNCILLLEIEKIFFIQVWILFIHSTHLPKDFVNCVSGEKAKKKKKHIKLNKFDHFLQTVFVAVKFWKVVNKYILKGSRLLTKCFQHSIQNIWKWC